MTRPLDHIARMAAYAMVSLESSGEARPISLSQNESLRPPSPRAIEAARQSLSDGALYPDPDWSALRQALAKQHGIKASAILCGNGSLDLIGALARVYAGPERAALAPDHAYPFFRTATLMAGARFDTAPEREVTVDIDAMLAAVRPDTGLVFLANPGNPTGTRIPRREITRLREGLRDDILLIVDEAYGEFADHLGESCFDMIEAGNTVVLRTFSKAYGMAGFRVGWGLFPPTMAAELRKVMNPNNIPAASQAAAVAALRDQDYMRQTCAETARLRDGAAEQLRQLGFKVVDSQTNFLLMDFETPERARSADQFLQSKGVLLRAQGGAGLAHMLRMTIGPQPDLDAALNALQEWQEREAT